MAEGTEDTEKPFDPTPQKLQEARKKGDVAKSQDVNATAAYFGLFLAFMICANGPLQDSAQAVMFFLDKPDQVSAQFFASDFVLIARAFASEVMVFLALTFLIPIGLVITSAIAQQSVTFAPSKIAPKLNRISPVSTAKQKFGPAGLFEFFKSFVKLVTYSAVLFTFLLSKLSEIASTPGLDATQGIALLGRLVLNFLGLVVLVSLVIGSIDYVFQYFEHRRKLRMSRKEIQDETKQSEGDPHMKQERMSRGRDRAMSQSMKDVETADVVITNPTHFAVALRWSREPGSAPVCVAKGTDEVAKNIREIAKQHNIPLHEDPPTARALFSSTRIGDEIPVELYQAVATAIQYAETVRQALRARPY